MEGTTKGEQIISQGMQNLINLNRETNQQLKQLRDDSPDLKDSIKQNLGEIIATLSSSVAERAVAKDISRSTNMGVGVTKGGRGVDAGEKGSEPKTLSEKDTLFGITQKFYGKNTVADMIKATEKLSDMAGLDLDKLAEATGNTDKDADNSPEKKPGFFKRMGSGFFEGSGLKSFFAKTSKNFGKVTGFFKGFTFMKLGKILGAPFKLVGGMLMKGLTGLKNMSMKLLGKIKDGIVALPKKLLGFLGGAFSIISKIALILLAVVGLSKLIKFLRSVTPEEREKFIQGLVDNTKKLKTAVGKAADYITDVLIPALGKFTLGLKRVLSFFGLYTMSADERAELTTDSALNDLKDKRARFANARIGKRRLFKTEKEKNAAIAKIDEQIKILNDPEYFKKVVESEEIRMSIMGPGRRRAGRNTKVTKDSTGVNIYSKKDADAEREGTAIGDFFKNLGGENKNQGRKRRETLNRRDYLIPKKDNQSKTAVDNKKLVSQINQSNDNSTNFVGGSSAFQLAIQHNNFHYG